MFKWFKGKVYVYKNINWKEEEFEKEFDNPQDFHAFERSYHQPEMEWPFMWLGDWTRLHDYFNNLIDQRFGLWCNCDECEDEEENECHLPSGINLDEYEQELQKMEYAKAHKTEKIQQLKDTLARLKDYKKRFKAEWRDDMVEKIDADISATQASLDELDK